MDAYPNLRGDYSHMAADYTIPQAWDSYTAEQHARWRMLYARQAKLLKRYAAQEFIDGTMALDAGDGIPDLEIASARLAAKTGWRLVAVPGLIPETDFFAHLARRQFPVTNWIRKADEIYMEAVASGDFHSLTESNKTLHMEIGQAANNPYFLKHYERLLDEGQRLSHLHFDFMVTSSTGDELGQDHADLVDAIDRKDADAAEQLAHEHTMLFQHRFLNMMRQNTTQSMTILPT